MSFDNRNNDPSFAPGDTAPNNVDDGSIQEKPTKAIIGIGVLLVLSLLLYQVNQFSSSDPSSPSQNVAQRQISAPAPQTPN